MCYWPKPSGNHHCLRQAWAKMATEATEFDNVLWELYYQRKQAPFDASGFRLIGIRDGLDNMYAMILTNRVSQAHDETTPRNTLEAWSVGWCKGKRAEVAPWILQHVLNLTRRRINIWFPPPWTAIMISICSGLLCKKWS